jgi:hypothetical protein
VACHDYKRNRYLTLILGPNKEDYILLNKSNIENIFRITGGNVASIKFIDIDEETEPDEFQYNDWNAVVDQTIDYIFTMYCDAGFDEEALQVAKNKLKTSGRIINILSFPSEGIHPNIKLNKEDLYPLMCPLFVTDGPPQDYFIKFLEKNSTETDVDDEDLENHYVNIITEYLPTLNFTGKINIRNMTKFNIDESGKLIIEIPTETNDKIQNMGKRGGKRSKKGKRTKRKRGAKKRKTKRVR